MTKTASLTTRMAVLLERMAFALEAASAAIPSTDGSVNASEYPRSTRSVFWDSASPIVAEARALVEEYHGRHGC